MWHLTFWQEVVIYFGLQFGLPFAIFFGLVPWLVHRDETVHKAGQP